MTGLSLPTETALSAHHVRSAAGREGLELPLPPDVRGRDVALPARVVLAADVRRMLDTATRALGPAFPARCGAVAPAHGQSAVAFACRTASTIGAAVETMLALWPLVTDAFTFEQVVGRGAVALRTPEAPALASTLEFHLADMVGTARILAGSDFSPLAVRFAHRPRAPLGAYEDVFRCPVSFEQPATELLMDRDHLALPNLAPLEPGLGPIVLAHASTLLAERDAMSAQSWPERVRLELRAALGERDTRAAAVARRCGVSERTLHRRLAEAGASFRALLDAVRRDELARLSVEESLTQDALAARLGFADARVLRRATRRWFPRAGPSD
ncbi:MAG: AraC family transcriptional regulator ligand-binding domain-containing protein [Sandaracinaceae bacterium]